MLKYREFLSLTNEEIEFIIREIFPHTTKVDNITRDEKWNRMSCDIYIMEDKPLARMLYANVEIDQAIPPELYEAVANVLAFVYQIQGKLGA